jgi:thiamine kinase-like enzyme
MKDNNDIFKVIFKNLSARGISVLPETLKKHKYQGWMSSVFTVESKRGLLIIHLVRPVKEHQRNKIWDKFKGLSKILSSHLEIPAAKILYSGLVCNLFVIVQFFIHGSRAGKRVLNETVISDKWYINKADTVPNILRALASIHKIKPRGFGWPVLRVYQLVGKYKNWKEFFQYNYPLWIKEIRKADRRLFLKNNSTSLNQVIRRTVDRMNYSGPAVLVHGDSINPSNILVSNKNRTVILDWEWSILADPAWEFCDLGWWDQIDIKRLSPYFKAVKIKNHAEKIDFINRIKLYIPLWLLWGTYMHANDSNPSIYIALRKLLLDKLIGELGNYE